MKLYLIAKSNIKKNKGMTVTLIVLIAFATLLLYIGTSILLDIGNFLKNKNKEMNGSEFTVLAPKQFDNAIGNVFEEMGGYSELETENALVGSSVVRNETKKEEGQSIGAFFLNAEEEEQISRLKILEEAKAKKSNSVIAPYYLKVAKGYQVGDEISITFAGKEHKYEIYGFAEDIMFATPSNITFYKYYVFQDEFEKLEKEGETTQFKLYKTLLLKGKDQAQYNNDFVKSLNNKVKDATNNIITMDLVSMKVGVSIFLMIIMAVMVVFSFIILMIALTVMRFAIVTHIEGNMKNIGAMEAIGYTGKELIRSTIFQFMLVSTIGIGIGLGISFLFMGFITNLASSSIGLMWNVNINLLAVGINVISILLLVMLIAYFSAAKIKKITPITALRSGIKTHNFKKNYFPLDKTSGNKNLVIGLKNLRQNMKQNITILIIVTLMSFVSIFAITINYNFNVDNRALLQLVGIEKSQLMLTYEGENPGELFDSVSQMEHVKKTARRTLLSMTVSMEDKELTPVVTICNDYSLLEINTVIKGRYPIHDNEIAVASSVLKQLNAKMGDVICLQGKGEKQEFIVVGITQQISNLGRSASITEEGMLRVNSEFRPKELYIYLDSAKNTEAVQKEIIEKYKNEEIEVENVEKQFETILASFNSAINTLCAVCIAITLVIISLILYLLIRIKILKERVNLGVSKALGYTTNQLIMQMIFSFCPVCLAGALLGTVMGVYFVNPAFAAMMSVSGIQNCHFKADFLFVLITFITVSAFSVVVTFFVSRSMKRITPCELFQ